MSRLCWRRKYCAKVGQESSWPPHKNPCTLVFWEIKDKHSTDPPSSKSIDGITYLILVAINRSTCGIKVSSFDLRLKDPGFDFWSKYTFSLWNPYLMVVLCPINKTSYQRLMYPHWLNRTEFKCPESRARPRATNISGLCQEWRHIIVSMILTLEEILEEGGQLKKSSYKSLHLNVT